MRKRQVVQIVFCSTPAPQDRKTSRCQGFCSTQWRIWKGGPPKIFDDLFWDADQPPEIPVRKILTTLFFSVTFPFLILFFADLVKKNPAKRHPSHHQSHQRGGGAAPDRLPHTPRQKGGRSHHRPPSLKYATGNTSPMP
jgi:hypothetical protein